jgi:hypothetical protein
MARKKSRGTGRTPKRAAAGDMKPRKNPRGGAGGVPGSPSPQAGGVPGGPTLQAGGIPGAPGLLAGGVPGIRRPSDAGFHETD